MDSFKKIITIANQEIGREESWSDMNKFKNTQVFIIILKVSVKNNEQTYLSISDYLYLQKPILFPLKNQTHYH